MLESQGPRQVAQWAQKRASRGPQMKPLLKVKRSQPAARMRRPQVVLRAPLKLALARTPALRKGVRLPRPKQPHKAGGLTLATTAFRCWAAPSAAVGRRA